MTKKQRRNLHAAINSLSHDEVADIVKKEFPRATGKKLAELAREMIGEAHGLVSPRK